ncbi:hypothetical protein ACN5OL_000147 [Cronobacter sakazakii]|nr:hypothetical protein [Cronobacter sakazakii]EKK7677028.1 hypothetical protein [Cronobacter sakazakii]
MQRFTDSIRKSLSDQNWFAALFMALAMPDICGAIEAPTELVGSRYRQWFRKYLGLKYENGAAVFTADDCYKFRCKCLHQGLVEKDKNERFCLSPPVPPHKFHLMNIGGLIQVQIDILCEDICLGVDAWQKDVEDNAEIQARISELIALSFHPAMRTYISNYQ